MTYSIIFFVIKYLYTEVRRTNLFFHYIRLVEEKEVSEGKRIVHWLAQGQKRKFTGFHWIVKRDCWYLVAFLVNDFSTCIHVHVYVGIYNMFYVYGVTEMGWTGELAKKWISTILKGHFENLNMRRNGTTSLSITPSHPAFTLPIIHSLLCLIVNFRDVFVHQKTRIIKS